MISKVLVERGSVGFRVSSLRFRDPNSRPSGKTPAAAPPEALSSSYFPETQYFSTPNRLFSQACPRFMHRGMIGFGTRMWFHLLSVFGFRVSGFGIRVSGFEFRVSDFGSRVSGFGFRVSDFRFRISGVECKVYGSLFRV